MIPDDATEQITNLAIAYAPKLAAAVVVVVLGWIAAGIAKRLVKHLMSKGKIDPGVTAFGSSIAHAAILALVVISALGQLGVDTTSFAAIIAAAGLAVGLALQGSLANFAAGVMILVFRPFRVGDYIEAAGTAGVIEEIQIFAAALKTPDNKRVIIPNAAITAGNITNYSANATRRVDMTFGIGYDDDIKKAKQVIERILTDHKKVLTNPAPDIAVANLGESSVDIVVRPWVKTADYWEVRFALQEAIKLTFDAEGISFPFPQRDVHVVGGSELSAVA